MKKRSVLNAVVRIAFQFAKLGAESASLFHHYQPKLPDSLKCH